jgi:hypothetical protein
VDARSKEVEVDGREGWLGMCERGSGGRKRAMTRAVMEDMER